MCGLAGMYKGGISPVKPDTSRLTQLLFHRGPDHSGHFENDSVFLFHSRLKILDLSDKANQPMINEGSGDVLVFNGEIYNHLELRADLEKAGCLFNTRSDSEVLLKGLSKMGSDFIGRLDGEFALAFWNAREKKLILARDSFGVKPLYYGYSKDALCFSSEIKPLFELGVPRLLHEHRIADYLRYRYIPGDETLFKGIKHLQPGHFAEIGENSFTVKKYSSVPPSAVAKDADAFHRVFSSSVRSRLSADVEISLLLSGGVDSSALAALAAGQVKEKLKAFTYLFKKSPSSISDVARASSISKKFNLHQEIIAERANFTSESKKIIAALEEPIGDAMIFANYDLMAAVSRQTRVAISGEGADEIFCGYAHHRAGKWPLLLLRLPLLNKIMAMLVKFIPAVLLDAIGVYPAKLALHGKRRLLNVLKANTAGEMYKELVSLFSEDEIRHLLKGKPGPDSLVFENDFQTTDMKNWLPKYSLIRLDKLSMAHSVETRFPYLATSVFNCAAKLKFNSVSVFGSDKRGFRSYCDKFLGLNTTGMRKYPFFQPAESFSDPDYTVFLRETLSPAATEKYGIFKTETIADMMAGLSGSTDFIAHKKLVSLAIFQLWLEQFWPEGL